MKALLEVKGLCAGYNGRTVLRRVDVSLLAGQMLLVVGPNGAGKTTLLRVLAGLIDYRGHVCFKGVTLAPGLPEERARAGLILVPDTRGNFLSLTVLENLRVGAHARRDRATIEADLDHLFVRFGRLAQLRRSPVSALSGGEQQMLAIARALMARPQLLLLDEPSAGLSPRAAEAVQETLAELRAELGFSVLMVEQEPTPAWRLADRVLLLEDGEPRLEGPPGAVRADPRYEASFLGNLIS